MSTQLDLLLQMVNQAPGRFDAFLAQMNLSPEEAKTLREGLGKDASPDEARAATTALAGSIWAFLDEDQPDAITCP